MHNDQDNFFTISYSEATGKVDSLKKDKGVLNLESYLFEENIDKSVALKKLFFKYDTCFEEKAYLERYQKALLKIRDPKVPLSSRLSCLRFKDDTRYLDKVFYSPMISLSALINLIFLASIKGARTLSEIKNFIYYYHPELLAYIPRMSSPLVNINLEDLKRTIAILNNFYDLKAYFRGQNVQIAKNVSAFMGKIPKEDQKLVSGLKAYSFDAPSLELDEYTSYMMIMSAGFNLDGLFCCGIPEASPEFGKRILNANCNYLMPMRINAKGVPHLSNTSNAIEQIRNHYPDEIQTFRTDDFVVSVLKITHFPQKFLIFPYGVEHLVFLEGRFNGLLACSFKNFEPQFLHQHLIRPLLKDEPLIYKAFKKESSKEELPISFKSMLNEYFLVLKQILIGDNKIAPDASLEDTKHYFARCDIHELVQRFAQYLCLSEDEKRIFMTYGQTLLKRQHH